MGVVGRCGVVMIQGLQAPQRPRKPKRPCKLQRPRGPRRAGQTASTHSRVRAWIPQGKASNGIDIYWQATDAGKSAFRDDGGCGEHGACGERGRIRGAYVGSVAVVASVACVASVAVVACVASVAVVASVASVAVVASVLRGCMGRTGSRNARDARKAYGFIRFILMSCPFQCLHQEGAIPEKKVKSL